jgi:hypothetical protein
MSRQAIGWVVLVGLSVACGSSGGTAQPDTEPGSNNGEIEPSTEANAADPAPDPAVRYQFVGTPEGMTVEAVSGTEVQTFSCPTRSCAGFCDECAARACAASGELAGACAQLVRDCSDTCSCNGEQGGISSCGFPVCALNRNLCYIGDSGSLSVPGPQPDPNPLDPASRPSNPAGSDAPGSDAPSSDAPSSDAPSSSAPSGAGANISLPAG